MIETRFQHPQLWANCSLPQTVVEPLLPPHVPSTLLDTRPGSALPHTHHTSTPAPAGPHEPHPILSREAHLTRGWLPAAAAAAGGASPCGAGAAASAAAEPLSSLDAAALRQRVEARAPTADSWRGFSVSMPFLPGGDSVDPKASAAAAAAAAEAGSGAWLRRLERGDGRPPGRVCAPGLARGVFGAWGLPEEDAVLCEWGGKRCGVGGGVL